MKRQRDGEDGGDGSDGENKQSAINGQQQRQPVRTLAPMKRARTTTTTTATAQLATISFNIKPAAAAAVAVPVCSSEKHVRPFVKPELFTKIADAIDLDEAVRNAALECLLNLQQPPSTSTSSTNNGNNMETVLGCLLLGVVLAAADNYNTKQTPTTTTATTTTTTPEIDPQIPRRIIRLLIASKKIGQIQSNVLTFLKTAILTIANTCLDLYRRNLVAHTPPSLESQLTASLNTVVGSVMNTSALFETFHGLYTMLLTHILPDTGMNNLFNNSMYKYTWQLVIYIHDLLKMDYTQWGSDQSKALCFAVIFWIAHNAPRLRKTTNQVLSSIHELQQKPFQPSEKLNVDWKHHWDNIHPLFAHLFPFMHPNIVQQALIQVKNMCQEMEIQKILKHIEKTTLPNGIVIYQGSFDVALQAFLQSNISGLNQRIDQLLYNGGYQMDPRIYLPESLVNGSRPSRGMLKTPRPASSKVTSRHLGEALQKASYYNNLMAATPITAKSAINKRGVAMMEDTRTAKEKFAAVTSTEFLHPEKYANHLVAYTKDPVIQAQIRESIQVCTLDVNGFIEEWNGKGPDYRGFAEQAIRLYHRVLMSVIDSECSRFRRVSIPLLLRDEAFRHCLLACAGEMIRHVFEIRFFNFENLLTSLHVRKLDLVMMIDLVLKGLGGWLPKMAIKRLAGISERFLEMEIWDERDLFVLMNAAKQQQQGGRDVATCSFQTSAMNLLYDEVNMPAQMYGKNVNLDEINHNHVPRLAKLVIDKLVRLHSMRLASLCHAMDITEADFMRSKLFFEQLIDKELELGLFHKRNMDAIMICCLYCVLKFRDVNVGMEELSAHYAKQPQYVVAYLTNVFISPTESRACLLTFYNKIFIPRATSVFRNLVVDKEKMRSREMTEILYDLHRKFYISQQSMENTPELLTPMRKRITSYKETSATSSNPMMTPLTRLLMSNNSTLRIPSRSSPLGSISTQRKLTMRGVPNSPLGQR